MPLAVFLLVLFSLLPPSLVHADQARSFLLRAQDQRGQRLGHWTLLNYQGRCRALTVYHLTGSKPKSLQMAMGTEEVAARLFRFDAQSDLAEVLPEGKPLVCDDLQSLEIAAPDVSNCRDVGCPGSHFHATSWLSGQLARLVSYGWAAEFEPIALPWKTLSQAFRLRRFPVVAGTSGTAVERENRLLGLVSDYVPFQDIGIVIPLPGLISFLNSTSNVTQERPSQRLGTSAVHFSHGPTQPAGSGGNGHDGGSIDSWLQAGADTRLRVKDVMAALRERDEGIPDPAHPDQVVLAVDGKRVDGWSDYYNYMKEGSVVLRRPALPPHDYLPLDERKAVVAKLLGTYKACYEATMKILLENATNLQGWDIGQDALGDIDIRVTGDSQHVAFSIRGDFAPDGTKSMRNLTPNTLSEFNFRQKRSPVQYDVKLSAQTAYKVYSGVVIREIPGLGRHEFPIQCENKHFTKLICGSEQGNFELSLSLDNEVSRLSYRIAEILPGSQPARLTYLYGELDKTPEKTR